MSFCKVNAFWNNTGLNIHCITIILCGISMLTQDALCKSRWRYWFIFSFTKFLCLWLFLCPAYINFSRLWYYWIFRWEVPIIICPLENIAMINITCALILLFNSQCVIVVERWLRVRCRCASVSKFTLILSLSTDCRFLWRTSKSLFDMSGCLERWSSAIKRNL